MVDAFSRERVSIVIPFFRAEKYLDEALRSVFAQQRYHDWRLYLIDDGSDENDTAIAGTWAAAHPDRIRVLEHPGRQRRGISAARNLAIQRSQGDLIAFLDADDVWYPHKLASQVSILDRHPEAGMVYGAALRWRSWNGGLDEHVPANVTGFGSDCLVPGPALLDTFRANEALTPCTGSVLIRRHVMHRSGYFEEQFRGLYDDQVLYAKLCLAGNVYVSSDTVSKYRKHSRSCCSQAAVDGTGTVERERFLEWLENYERSRTIGSPLILTRAAGRY